MFGLSNELLAALVLFVGLIGYSQRQKSSASSTSTKNMMRLAPLVVLAIIVFFGMRSVISLYASPDSFLNKAFGDGSATWIKPLVITAVIMTTTIWLNKWLRHFVAAALGLFLLLHLPYWASEISQGRFADCRASEWVKKMETLSDTGGKITLCSEHWFYIKTSGNKRLTVDYAPETIRDFAPWIEGRKAMEFVLTGVDAGPDQGDPYYTAVRANETTLKPVLDAADRKSMSFILKYADKAPE